MITILLILSTGFFFLTAIVFGTSVVKFIKKEIFLGLGFLAGFVYAATSFGIQINGIISCKTSNILEACIQYPKVHELPVAHIGFDLISEDLRLFLINVLTFSVLCFLIYFLRRLTSKK